MIARQPNWLTPKKTLISARLVQPGATRPKKKPTIV